MTFLEYFNLSKGEKNSASISTGSLSDNERTHKHQRGLYGKNQILGKAKNINAVARYLIKDDDLVSRCRETGKDQILNFSSARLLCKKYNGDERGLPTQQEPQKGLKGTGVYMILLPNGSYKLTFKGVQDGKATIPR
jgi:hypothetical protein